jgi:hypothetical protein
MSFLFLNLPTLAIAAVFCAYEACLRARRRRERALRERVAFMLWVMAHEEGEPVGSR